MTELLQRIRELSTFDVEKPTTEDTEFLTACYPDFKKDPLQELQSLAGLHGFKSGRDCENSRLTPLIEALIQAVEKSYISKEVEDELHAILEAAAGKV